MKQTSNLLNKEFKVIKRLTNSGEECMNTVRTSTKVKGYKRKLQTEVFAEMKNTLDKVQ